MSKAILNKIEEKIKNTSEIKDIVELAKAYADIEKADTQLMEKEAEIEDKSNRLDFDREKLNAEIEDRQTRAKLEQAKLDVDAVVRKTQVDNERKRIENDYNERLLRAELEQNKLDLETEIRRTQVSNDRRRTDLDYEVQQKKIKAASTDNFIMAGAMTGGIFLMYWCEKSGILLSRNAGALLKFARFGKIF